mmetsp:Transcript_30028/g.72101  ORF Transcript_30028/g.72101 Transcript_30028/m.72101 type:complete len:273 (+) Transcript_30028:40-858(+)
MVWLITNDCCGLVCVLVTYTLIFGSSGVVSFGMLVNQESVIGILLIIVNFSLALMAAWSHLSCMLTDPGAVHPDEEVEVEIELDEVEEGTEAKSLKDGKHWCKKCPGPKPPRAHHCSICQRCIRKMDHHCPWVNNCVGQYNQKHFLLFCVYTCFLSSFTIAVLAIRAYSCSRDYVSRLRSADKGCHLSNAVVLMGMLVFFAAVVFALFTLMMFCDQMSCIMYDQTGIEALQNTSMSAGRGWRDNVREVFGGPCSPRWLVPLAIKRMYPKCSA